MIVNLLGYYAKTGEYWDDIEVHVVKSPINGNLDIVPADWKWLAWDSIFEGKVIFAPEGVEINNIPKSGFRRAVDSYEDLGDGAIVIDPREL